MKKETEKLSLLSRWKNREKKNQASFNIQKAPSNINLPLSHGQKRLWFLQQLYPKNPFYNYSETLTFNGDLVEDALIDSLKRIYLDHDIFRSTYHIDKGIVYQKINDETEIDISFHNLSTLSKEASTTQCRKILEDSANTYFDLSKSPLIRIALIKTSIKTTILQISMHHIICDKWSMEIFRKDLASYYNAFCLKQTITDKRTEIQYADYAYWQSKNEINNESLNFWKKTLSGEIPLLNLPLDHKRPLNPTFKGSTSFTQTYNNELSSKILSLSKQLDTTPYVLLLTVYYVFLNKYSGQTDILIGSPIANRDKKVLENLIGFFNETIILRTQIDQSINFEDLVKTVKQNTLDAFENKNIPFDILVKELQVERTLAVNPFFQVMFLYHSVPETPIFNKNVSMTHTWFDSKVSKFDLTLYIAEENGILSSTFEYASDLFDEITINRFQDYFKLLLESVVLNSKQTISEISMLTEKDNQFFLSQNNNSTNAFLKFNGIHNIIENISHSNPNDTAVTYNDTLITYKTLNYKSTLLANQLINNISTHNEIIGLCIDRSIDMIIGMLAILKSGCAYLPIDPEYPEHRIKFMLNDAKVNKVITQKSYATLFQHYQIEQVYIDNLEKLSDLPKKELPITKNSDLAYIIYTSGSTGNPKGVPITHKNIINSTAGRLNFYDETPTAFMLLSSISFDSSKAGIFWTLCTGGNLVIAKKRIEQDINAIGNLIENKRISHTLMLPSLYKLILDYIDVKKLESLKTTIVAGEACYPQLVTSHFNKLNEVKLYNEYGPTEATVWCIAHQIQKDRNTNIVPIGKPVAGAKIYLLNEQLNLVPFGSIGEIYIGGNGLANGYWNRPELSKQAFITSPFNAEEKLYKTGDLGRYTNDKNIEFLGRTDQQIKIRGFRVELNEIEKAIKTYDETIDDAIVLVENHQNDINSENLVDILKNINDDEVNEIFSSIELLNNNEKEYLLTQIEKK